MNHFGLSRSRRCDVKLNKSLAPSSVDLKTNNPVIIEGAEYLDLICPVSSLSGNRMSIYEAMQIAGTEKFSRQLDAFLAEFPANNSDSRLSDDDRVSVLASRLNTGVPAEDERYAKQLSQIVGDLYEAYDKSVKESASKETIKFDSADATPSESSE